MLDVFLNSLFDFIAFDCIAKTLYDFFVQIREITGKAEIVK